jgi:hypothetical protein
MTVFTMLKNNKRLTVQVNELINFTEQRKKKLYDAIEILESVVNSQRFKDRFLSAKFIETNGMTNEQIYKMLMSGKDQFGGEDSDIDLHLTFYHRWWSRVVGYILPSGKQYINGKFFDSMDLPSIANNLLHEYMHRLGFIDPRRNPLQGVPYQTGNLCEELARGMLKSYPEIYK